MPRADRVDPEDRLDRFAELLSLDIPIPDICRGEHGKGAGYALLMKIRQRLGPQAV